MLKNERSYEFRKRIDVVHQCNINDSTCPRQADECEITSAWKISASGSAPEAVKMTVRDLEEFFQTSMGMTLCPQWDGESGIVLKLDENSGLINGASQSSSCSFIGINFHN